LMRYVAAVAVLMRHVAALVVFRCDMWQLLLC